MSADTGAVDPMTVTAPAMPFAGRGGRQLVEAYVRFHASSIGTEMLKVFERDGVAGVVAMLRSTANELWDFTAAVDQISD